MLTGVSMAGAGALVYALESAQIENDINQQIDQEISEFRALESNGTDPETGEPFASAESLLRLFLARQVTDDDEMLVIYAGNEAVDNTPHPSARSILGEEEYQDAVAAGLSSGGTSVYESPQFSEVWITVLQVQTPPETDTDGALVIINLLDDERSELVRTIRTYAVITLLSLLLITFLALWQSGRLLAPLTTLRQTAREITARDLSRRIPARGNDDITALTHTINDMLDRLEAGFEAQRNFLDDAGHELKTPLTVVRGHLELLAHGNEDEVAETRELLLDEVDRMSRLVEDLVLLAKARRPDFLSPRQVDLDRLTHAVLAKSRALGDRDWQLDGTGEAQIIVDEQRITQAVLQLADNAVKHTDPGDVVAIGSSYDDVNVRLWVRDTGDGVPEADRQHVFERFGRSTVRPGDEGFGLGLSIVKAIAVAHGGTVTVTEASGRGARFELELPKEGAWPGS
ncbi:MAG: HAMP domain-containing histidine kinase [Actinomycetota bacterium]|nr:HAMP domain-containing histidine kinase [Actinomycetota bacterium]